MARKKKKEAEDVENEVGKIEGEEQVEQQDQAENEEETQPSAEEQETTKIEADKETEQPEPEAEQPKSEQPEAEDTGAERTNEPEGDKEDEKVADVVAAAEQKDDSSKKERKSKEDAGSEAEQKDEPNAKKEQAEDAVGEKEEKGKKKGKKDKKKDELPPGAHLEPILVEDKKKREETDDDVAARYAAKLEVSEESGKGDVVSDKSDEVEPEKAEEEESKPKVKPITLEAGKNYQATGKRKNSIARVNLRAGTGEMVINKRSVKEYFPRDALQYKVFQPLRASGAEGQVDVIARVRGGGVAGQAHAVGHGIARALVSADPELRSILKKRGHLTRDSRVKERRKAGLKKARKKPQFSKR